MSSGDAARNLGARAFRRLMTAHKPLVRLARRGAREREQRGFRRAAAEIDGEVARVAAGRGPILAGPWLAEVGYEVLYWIPFLRWFQDVHRVSRERLIVVSRGGVSHWYDDIGAGYVDIFDLMSVGELADRNRERSRIEEGGGQKQSSLGTLDEHILDRVRERTGIRGGHVFHPSLLFRLFRHVWHGNLPMDFLWRRTEFRRMNPPLAPAVSGLPRDFIAVKFYSGTAVPMNEGHSRALRNLVARAAEVAPVIVLETDMQLDEHRDFAFDGIANVTSARHLMTPGNNLGVQSAMIGQARYFLGTCGGLAWLAPFLGTPTVAVYGDDRMLGPHLFIARQAGRQAGAAEFSTLDLRALERLDATRGTGNRADDTNAKAD
jgi:hypothetical protein